jgi:uncharacterized membrane protein
MDKQEFLEILRHSLSGEVNPEVIDQNIKYYDQYISSRSVEEEERILEELGNPRLIARTIIETDKIAKQKGKFHGNQSKYSDYYTEEQEGDNNQKRTGYGSNLFFTNIKWYHKLIVALVLITVIIILVLIGRIIIGFLFAFGIPIILLLLLMALFRRRY